MTYSRMTLEPGGTVITTQGDDTLAADHARAIAIVRRAFARDSAYIWASVATHCCYTGEDAATLVRADSEN